jgi:predicted nuclease of predicted toxin-antitoxin system
LKLLIDESLSARISARRQAAGHDAVHVRDLELGGADDQQVMAAAAVEGRIPRRPAD